jgi:hypothetical protein
MRRPRCLLQILIILLYLLWFIPMSSGQLANDWQPVPKEDLALKDNPAAPGSSAMILERQIYTDDEKRVETEWVRIKIFTEAGRAYADVVIPYLVKRTSVEDIRGRTVRPDGTVIPFSGAAFDKIIIKYKKFRYHAKVFTLPAVEVGSIIEYAYAVHWKDRFPDYVTNPGAYIFKDGWTVPTTTWTIQQDLFTRHAVFVIRPVKGGRLDFAKVRLPDNFPSWQPDKTMRMEVNNVAAIEQEDYMPPDSFLNSRVHFYYIVGPVYNYWRTISRLKAEVNEKFIEKTRFLEKSANDIAPPGDPPETRLRKLYARVQQVRYLSYEPSKTKQEIKNEHLSENKSAEDILRHNYGNANEINLLFTALARAAGFDASVVEVVDRASAIFEPQVPDAFQLNAMVVLIRLNGQNLYFDPATRFCPYGLVPWFESDTSGIKWDKVGGDVLQVQVPATEASAVERTADLKLKPDGGLEGTLDIVLTGQEALDMRLSGYDEDEAGRRKLLEDQVKELTPPGATIDLDTVTGWQESEQPLRVHCRLHASRFATVTHQRMLLHMAVFQANRTNPLHHTSRVQPVYLQHGYRETDKITISIPTGYRLEALPSAAEDNASFATFSAKSTSQGDLLQFERRAELKGYFFPVQSYGSLRAYFEKMRQSDAENLVLHKVDSARDQ